MAHLGGALVGVRSLREAWDAAIAGIDITANAATHKALRQALETFK